MKFQGENYEMDFKLKVNENDISSVQSMLGNDI